MKALKIVSGLESKSCEHVSIRFVGSHLSDLLRDRLNFITPSREATEFPTFENLCPIAMARFVPKDLCFDSQPLSAWGEGGPLREPSS